MDIILISIIFARIVIPVVSHAAIQQLTVQLVKLDYIRMVAHAFRYALEEHSTKMEYVHHVN